MNWKTISLLFEMLIGLKFIDKINSVYQSQVFYSYYKTINRKTNTNATLEPKHSAIFRKIRDLEWNTLGAFSH